MTTHILRPEFDFSSLSVEDKLALSKQLEEEARRDAKKEFDSTINFLVEKLKKMGRSKTDAVTALVALMDEKERKPYMRFLRHAPSANGNGAPTSRTTGKKKEADYLDWDGESRAVVGKTYQLPEDSTVKFTRGPVGAIHKQFLAAIGRGKKWKDMEVKQPS